MGEPKPDWQVRAEEHRRERWIRLIDKETRQRILDRDYPGRLEWPDPCPVDAGDEIPLHRDVTVIVNRPRPVDKSDHSQGWRTSYTVRDLRPEFLLRRVPPDRPPRRDEFDEHGNVPPPGPATAEKTRIESSYTTTAVGAVSEAGEGIDPDWHDQGKEKREEMRLQAVKEEQLASVAERKIRAIKSRLNMVGVHMVRTGLDPVPYLDRIEGELKAMEAEVERGKLREAA